MRLAAEQSNQFAEAFARVGLGLVARRSGDLDTAEALFKTSLTWNQRLKADYGIPPAERGDVDRITAAMRGPSADRAHPLSTVDPIDPTSRSTR